MSEGGGDTYEQAIRELETAQSENAKFRKALQDMGRDFNTTEDRRSAFRSAVCWTHTVMTRSNPPDSWLALQELADRELDDRYPLPDSTADKRRISNPKVVGSNPTRPIREV